MMDHDFDIVVIGTGTAASTVAGRCREAGRTVAVIDEAPFGGTCALRGCDPKKILRRGPEIMDAAMRMKRNGVVPEGLHLDWSDMTAFKRTFTDPVPEMREKSFENRGIATFHGTAHFVGESIVAVGEARLHGRHIVIASGARPRSLDIPGEHLLTTSTEFMERDTLPDRVLFIGGGYISLEFAHMVARAGRQATVITRGPRPLGGFDPDLVDSLVARSIASGIDLRTGADVEGIETVDDGLRVHASSGDEALAFEADLVVHGAGRTPAIDALDLDQAHVRTGRNGVEVNDYLQSVSNPAVYAAGDAAATEGPALTPVSNLEGRTVAANLLGPDRIKPDYSGIPSVVFTLPALCRVGLLESEAQDRQLNFTARFTDMSGWYTARRVGETHAAAKVLVENGSGRLLGAHLLGPESSELINLFALAIRTGLGTDELKDFISAYPSAASDIGHLI